MQYLLEDGETPTDSIVETIGGGGANSALAAAALGPTFASAARSAPTPLGQRLEQSLGSRGVKTFIRRDPQVGTGSSVVLSYDNGCRHFISCQPNNETLAMSDVDLADALRCRTSAAGRRLVLRADARRRQRELFQAARARAGHLARHQLGPAMGHRPKPARSPGGRKPCGACCRWSTWSTAMSGELNRFADSADLDATLGRITDWGAGAIVVHMGADGAGYYRDGQWTVSPCRPRAAVQEHGRHGRPAERLHDAPARLRRDPGWKTAFAWPTRSWRNSSRANAGSSPNWRSDSRRRGSIACHLHGFPGATASQKQCRQCRGLTASAKQWHMTVAHAAG